MKVVEAVYDDTKKRRVIIFTHADGTFGFEEEHFSEEPLENAWIPAGRYSIARCDTKERAMAEARSRVTWLAAVQDKSAV